MNKQKNKKRRGIAISVSPEAHEKMLKEAFAAKPRRTLRQHINVLNNLAKDL